MVLGYCCGIHVVTVRVNTWLFDLGFLSSTVHSWSMENDWPLMDVFHSANICPSESGCKGEAGGEEGVGGEEEGCQLHIEA
jgi:hypothetical protein